MDPGDDDEAVFVYGTLRPGRSNWAVVADLCRAHEPARLPGFALYDLDHPAVVRRDGRPTAVADGDPDADRDADPGVAVVGDLLRFGPGSFAGVLDRLDRFEGYQAWAPESSYYTRARLAVTTASGRCVAWVYLPGPRLLEQVREERRVPGDDWRG